MSSTRPLSAALTALAALALTGCAAGAQTAQPTAPSASRPASTSARPTTAPASVSATPTPYDTSLNGPRTSAAVLPAGFHFTVDSTFTTADPVTAAVYDAVRAGYTAEFQAIGRQQDNDELYHLWFMNSGPGTNGLTNAQTLVRWFTSRHYTVTGTLTMRDWTISPSDNPQMWKVTACEDQSRTWSKNLRTGQVIYNPANPQNYYADTFYVAQLAHGERWRTVYTSSAPVSGCS